MASLFLRVVSARMVPCAIAVHLCIYITNQRVRRFTGAVATIIIGRREVGRHQVRRYKPKAKASRITVRAVLVPDILR